MQKINKDKKGCVVVDDSKRNIQRCIEIGIQYEYINKDNNIINVLNKLIKI